MMVKLLECQECGDTFDRKSKQRPKFCSNACKQKAYRARSKNASVPLARFRSESRWVRAKGKKPLQVSGKNASSTNPRTWTTFENVLHSKAGDGFGVMLGNGLGCYDIDHCFEGGNLKGWAVDYIHSIAEEIVYTEVSKSGEGLHLFFLAKSHGPGFARNGVERYTQERFIRMTLDSFKL